MKNRVISGCVTVTEPPLGDLLLELRDHAARAAEHVAKAHRLELRARARLAAAPSTPFRRAACSAPITLIGLTALSVEISTNARDVVTDRRARDAQRAEHVVAHRLPRVYCSSISGTCL